MALTYSSFVSEIATLTTVSSTILVSGDTNFGGIMAGIIDYAEGRIYRDLDIISASVVNTATTCSSGVRSIFLSTASGTPLQIDALNLLTSAGTTSSNATRVPLVPVARSVLDMIYPSALSSNCAQPQYFARLSDTELILGPTPDQAYGTEVQIVIRPNALSSGNSSTWITQNVPELMVAAGMIFAAGYMRNYGAQADDPKMSASWEAQYTNLLRTAQQDASRQKFEGPAWTQQGPSPQATPPRV